MTGESALPAAAGAARWRHLRTDDLDEIMGLEDQLFGADAWPRDGFEAELLQPETREYVAAEAGGRIIAYGGIMCVPPIADIQTIGVAREAQGRGLGRALLRRLVEASRARGAEDILLEVREDNAPARALYESEGFSQIHVRKRYYRDGCDALIMQLKLTPTGDPR
ncbi:ribosomal protein S18-alanine N-acetyltransferase [Falsarthrobacter nasiphocae]|uniref:Ribosomal-protein-alanine N-acetyltransferase n=1 Tax=Falsarthrobacter nasiphocae TaxID=189863 RepID=A0AAE3YH05_9MICC|nr:ribosomal protein S18-alanine N-acetyltransferase [Falsarthrobacter nasiphocae]MDR6892562.1 ribosomal-protein-alanine N-acetyltransferase [Falsarthrobacter nasiphocae]